MKRTLKRGLKVLEIVKGEPNGISDHFCVIQQLTEGYGINFQSVKACVVLYLMFDVHFTL